MSEAARLSCPFCTSALPDAALRCAACGQDVALIMPTLRRLQAHEEAITELRAEIERLNSAERPALTAPVAMPSAGSGSINAFIAAALSFLLLVGVHYLIVIQFDLPTILLRIASIAIPFALVLLLPGSDVAPLRAFVVSGVLMGMGAVLSMSAVVSVVDAVPVFPTDRRGQRELFEYAASMACAHIAGGALLHARRRWVVSQSNMTDKAAIAQRLAEAATPLGALLASIYAGLASVFG